MGGACSFGERLANVFVAFLTLFVARVDAVDFMAGALAQLSCHECRLMSPRG